MDIFKRKSFLVDAELLKETDRTVSTGKKCDRIEQVNHQGMGLSRMLTNRENSSNTSSLEYLSPRVLLTRQMDINSIMTHVNAIRQRHGVAPLQWAPEASERARGLLNADAAQPDSVAVADRGFGDNLAMELEGRVDHTTACIHAFDIWQAESSEYDFGNPGYSETTAQFAAMVYKATTHVGLAIRRNGRGRYNVAAVFTPRGVTHADDFRSNVFPPLSGHLEQGRGEIPSSVCVCESSSVIKGLKSPDGRFSFMLQPDHSLVLHKEEDAIWAIYVIRQPGGPENSTRLVLDTMGNLMVVDAFSGIMWESGTGNRTFGPFTLSMQDDGDCVLYGAGGVYLWSTRTAGWG